MSIQLRISDKPFIADIVFRDGKTRRIDYTGMTYNAAVATFFLDSDEKGSIVVINLAAIETIDCANAAQPVGVRQ